MTDSSKPPNKKLFDALRRFQDDFDKDFSIRDITPELSIKKSELMEINNLHDERQKVDKLFFTFIYIKKDVWPLIKCLQNSYEWLFNAIIDSVQKGDKWINDYLKVIHDIPNNQDWNIHRTQYLWEVQLNLKKLQRNQYLILFGKLGFGKRWLAADACRDFSVVNRMNFKIFWLNVSKCCTQELILEKMHRLKVLLQADDLDIKYNTYSGNTKNEIIHMRNYLRKILEQPEFRQCLIVLTDVQDDNITKAFDLNCKIFVTTRHIEKLEYIPKEAKTTIDIDKGFTECESKELFDKAFDNKLPADMTEYIEKFHNICAGHPFIMSIVAKSFQNFKSNDITRNETCDKWLKNLEKYDLRDKDIQIKMSMEESIKFLDIHQRVCYKKMSIFTDNSEIPLKVLEKIWDKDFQETRQIVDKLQKYSLLEKSNNEEHEQTCSLHYLHFHFLKQYVSENDQIDYHRHLIEKYEVEKILKERRELDLDFPMDNYFHYFIPYHLVGAKMEHLFDLYLDFGFLEQKMRFTKLCNTVGDLIRFESQITRKSVDRENFLSELIDFLTNSEQLIFKSEDVNLLQCALTSFGLVQKMAELQIQNYQDRVWMNDLNHEANQTQIVQLSGNGNSHPQLVRFVKPNDNLVCLISLHDNNVLLHDISQDYIEDPVLYRNELPSTLIDIQVFRNHAFLTLNDMGKMCVYTLKNSPKRRVSGPSRANLLNSHHNKVIQHLESLESPSDKITCFNLFETQQDSARTQVDLIVGTSQGNIKFYQWKGNKFEESKSMMIKTKFNGLFRMAHIVQEYVMLLSNTGEIRFVNLINSGSLGSICQWSRLEFPINLHQGICTHTNKPVSLCVSKHKVVQVTHDVKRRTSQIIFLEYDDVFVAKDDFAENEIISSTMSKDAEYLILGTTRGIIVIDRFEKKVIFRRNVSDQVLSLDIYRYHDEAMYLLSSVFKDAGHVISLHGFDGNRDELAMMRNDMSLLVGEDLFDIKQSSDEWEMVAVDTKSNIHHRSSAKDFTESIEKTAFDFHVKKVSYNGNKIVVGCTNGSVKVLDEFGHATMLDDLRSEITYLECFDGTIIASCSSVFKIIGIDKEFLGKLNKAYRYNETDLVLIRKDCAIEIVNLSTGEITFSRNLAESHSCSAQVYCDSLVAIATEQNYIRIWKVDEAPDTQLDVRMMEVLSPVTSLAISADSSVLAVGYLNGTIEIVDLINMSSIQKLESHKRAIMNLQFSPWKDPNDPLILLSLSDSIVFWNIRSIQNNPQLKRKEATGRNRVSQRFKSPLKFSSSPSDTKILLATENLSLNETNSNPWRKKTGSSEKPELLSCIKLVAKSAKRIICNDDFTRFVTIDNEGNIYHLRMIDETENQLTIDYNGNPMQLSQ